MDDLADYDEALAHISTLPFLDVSDAHAFCALSIAVVFVVRSATDSIPLLSLSVPIGMCVFCTRVLCGLCCPVCDPCTHVRVSSPSQSEKYMQD